MKIKKIKKNAKQKVHDLKVFTIKVLKSWYLVIPYLLALYILIDEFIYLEIYHKFNETNIDVMAYLVSMYLLTLLISWIKKRCKIKFKSIEVK